MKTFAFYALLTVLVCTLFYLYLPHASQHDTLNLLGQLEAQSKGDILRQSYLDHMARNNGARICAAIISVMLISIGAHALYTSFSSFLRSIKDKNKGEN